MTIISILKGKLSRERKIGTKRKLEKIHALFYSSNLTKLARIFKTDKYGNHKYTPHYQKHFSAFRKKKVNLLEIGVGGYDNPISGGNSLRMWKSFFKRGKIFSIDIYDKIKLEESRIKIFKGSQVDNIFLGNLLKEVGNLSIIIDDGSHINEHVIKTFQFLFPQMKPGGVYVIEDIQTSYWPEYGGSSSEFNNQKTIMGYFKSLTDGLNHMEFLKPDYKTSFLDLNISSIHFYHNLIFVYKGSNNEKSNYLINNRKPTEI